MGMEALALGAMGVGTTFSVVNQLQQGKEAQQEAEFAAKESERQGQAYQKMAKARAAIALQNAEAIRRRAVEEAKITSEEGRRLLARQKSIYAANNILSNVDSPLVVEAQTKADIAKDVGFILETGRTESAAYESEAAYEKAYGKYLMGEGLSQAETLRRQGKAAKKKSLWNALSTGISGYGSMAYMGYQGGYWGGKGSKFGTSGSPVTKNTGWEYGRNFPTSAYK